MTIAELGSKSKTLFEVVPRDLSVLLVLVLSALASFGLGIMAGKDMAGVGQGNLPGQGTISTSQISLTAGVLGASQKAGSPETLPAGGQVVASKNGTKYFLPWCAGAKNISEANKIWFTDIEAAKAKGYEPASNCKGL